MEGDVERMTAECMSTWYLGRYVEGDEESWKHCMQVQVRVGAAT